jgi:hypothetical protein
VKPCSLTVPALLCIVLSACATGYHPANGIFGYTGGYWEGAGPGKLTRIGFSANGFSKRATVGTYLLYRCAEVAQQRGKPYFSMYESVQRAIVDEPETAATYTSVTYGKPQATAYVLFHDAQVAGALSTQDVLKTYADQVKGAF